MPPIRLFAFLYVAALAVTARAEANKLDEMLDQIRQKTGAPALAVAAVQDGKIVAVSARGVRAQGQPDAVGLADPWLIGSCTKPMTRLLLTRLAAKHPELAPARTLGELLPGLPMREDYKAATLGEILEHKAGLPAYTRISPQLTPILFAAGGTPMEQRAKFIAHLLNEAPAGPRGKFAYSNAGYALLGHLAEKFGGRSWEELMAQELFAPLAMKDARVGFAPGAPRPQGHRPTPEGFRATDGGPQGSGALAPAGGVCLPIEDFARFALGALAAKSGEEGRILAGGQGHYTAAIALWPSRNLGVVVCTNAGEGDPIVEEVIRTVRKTYAPDVPEAGGPGPRLGVVLRGEADAPDAPLKIAIDSVVPGSIADQAGLKAGDVLVSINGQPVRDLGPNTPPPGLRDPGAKLVVRRAGREVEVTMPGK